jgi:hypothetical protein
MFDVRRSMFAFTPIQSSVGCWLLDVGCWLWVRPPPREGAAVTFLNIVLLGGLFAAAIPLIIHLLNRRRFQVVRWGAMMFLDDIVRTNRRRIRIEQLLLLLVRMAIPALLAVAMARPVLTGMRALIRRSPSSTVILFDNSFSMEAGDAGRSTAGAAREEAAAIVADLPRGSEAAVVGMAGPMPAVEDPTVDLVRIRSGLEDAPGGFGLARVAPALQTAAGLFASRMHQADRTLVIVSDFQRASWSAAFAEERRRAWDTLGAQAVPPRVVFFPAGASAADNISVESIELSRPIVGTGQRVMVRAGLRNHGRKAYPDLRVHFRVDGVDRAAAMVSLAPGETEQALFPCTFDRAGSHVVEVRTEADPLRADNAAMASIPVLDRIPVLLVSGDANPAPLRGETAFLEIALQPFSRGGGRMSDLLAARVTPEDRFAPSMLDDAKVVVLANVRQLSGEVVKALRDFVADGGGLLVFPGDRANTAWYATQFGGGDGLLPGTLGSLAGDPADDAGAASIIAQRHAHPALALFNDPRHGSLGGARIRAWYRLDVPREYAEDVAARLDTGDPFLVERRVGEGRVLLAAVPCDADWGNLPMRPFYLPLMQELVVYLASNVHPPRNVEVGDRLAAFLAEPEGEARAVVTDPEGTAHEVPVVRRGRRGVAEFAGTDRPGLYTLRGPKDEPVHFVVRTPREESDLARVTEEEMKALAAEAGAKVVRSGDDYRELERERRFGRELWRSAWWILLALLLGELLLQRWFVRRAA